VERLGEALPAFARRTNRLAKALYAIAFAAGGEGGARLAYAQAMPASPRTLLRLLSFSPLPAPSPHAWWALMNGPGRRDDHTEPFWWIWNENNQLTFYLTAMLTA